MRNHSSENELRLQVHFHANQTHCNLSGFALRLVLKQRHKGTRKWPILLIVSAFLMGVLKVKTLAKIKILRGC